jgi:benzylsuccinate CoA-transferase BbsF subunit
LDLRRRTGEGQQLDVSQFEAALHFLAPAIVEFSLSGNVMQPQGNRSDRYAPHGAYRCADVAGESWITIAVADDPQWQALARVLKFNPDAAGFETAVNRLERQTALDELIQDLVSGQDAGELAARLQEVGVAAYPVQSSLDLLNDPNLLADDFWPWLEQRDAGTMPYEGLSYHLHRTPSTQAAAPSLGADSESVLGEVLGLGKADIEDLRLREILI